MAGDDSNHTVVRRVFVPHAVVQFRRHRREINAEVANGELEVDVGAVEVNRLRPEQNREGQLIKIRILRV